MPKFVLLDLSGLVQCWEIFSRKTGRSLFKVGRQSPGGPFQYFFPNDFEY